MTEALDPWEMNWGAAPAANSAERDPWETFAPPSESTPLDRAEPSLRSVPGVMGNVAALTEPAVKALRAMLPQDGQELLDLVLSGLGAGAGIAVGTPGGPVGSAVGGATGAVLGKKLSRAITGAEQPGVGETIIDAGAGAVGPVASTASRLAGRAVTGLRRSEFDQGFEKGALEWLSKHGPSATRDASGKLTPEAIAGASKHAVDTATKSAISRATDRSAAPSIQRGVKGALAGASMFDPVVGSLIGVGVAEAVITRAVPALLNSKFGEPFAKWALRSLGPPMRGGEAARKLSPAKLSEAATSLLALAAENRVTGDARRAVEEIADSLKAKREPSRRVDLPRDPRGRWQRVDHSGFAEFMMQGRRQR